MLDGREEVADATLLDFWRWAYSDLRDNVARGPFAEWIVGRSLGCLARPRASWDNYDLEWNGHPIEVKSAAYLQAWPTRRLSRIVFGHLRRLAWDAETNTWDEQPSYRAEIYVFAVETATDHASFDPLDLGQWCFWVARRDDLARLGQDSVSLGRVDEIGVGPVGYRELRSAVERAIST